MLYQSVVVNRVLLWPRALGLWDPCCLMLINFRWLDVSVSNLTCIKYWVVYLQVIQEAVWPGGILPTAPQLERSQQLKDGTKQQALHCLMRLLPDLISEMLGSDKYRLSWQTVLDSFQHPYINRERLTWNDTAQFTGGLKGFTDVKNKLCKGAVTST
uniref:Sorting nexin 19 n=1 Tax=Amphilophus citrinellus TaxID=61819 RepID=A0A3Q0RHW1_AMPCI